MLIGFITNAQDQIIKKDGSELNVQITEISDTTLKYKKQGLTVAFLLDLSEVLLVTFENGERMTFSDVKSSKKGDIIKEGQIIAELVTNGDGITQLQFQIWKNNIKLNPEKWIIKK